MNDVTVGKYDIVIADVPTQITFQNAQFQQALDMRKFGVNVPDDEMILMSTLSRKNEIAKKVSGEQSDDQQQMAMQQFQMQIKQLEEEIEKLQSESYNKRVDAAKKAAEIAQMISENPQIGPLIDSILREEESRVKRKKRKMGLLWFLRLVPRALEWCKLNFSITNCRS